MRTPIHKIGLTTQLPGQKVNKKLGKEPHLATVCLSMYFEVIAYSTKPVYSTISRAYCQYINRGSNAVRETWNSTCFFAVFRRISCGLEPRGLTAFRICVAVLGRLTLLRRRKRVSLPPCDTHQHEHTFMESGVRQGERQGRKLDEENLERFTTRTHPADLSLLRISSHVRRSRQTSTTLNPSRGSRNLPS